MIIFIDKKGGGEGKIGGYMAAQGFAQQMSFIARTHAEFPLAEARYKAHPADAGMAIRMAGLYAGKGELGKAEAAIKVAEKSPLGPSGLAKAYNALGDQFRESRQFEKAVHFYKKGAKTATDAGDIAYANMSIAVTYLSQRMAKEAVPYLEGTIKMPKCPAAIVEQAKQKISEGTKDEPKEVKEIDREKGVQLPVTSNRPRTP